MKKDIDEELAKAHKELAELHKKFHKEHVEIDKEIQKELAEYHKEIQKEREAIIIKFLTSFGFSKDEILAYIPVLSEESFQFAEGVNLELDRFIIRIMMNMISFCGTMDKTIKILMEKGIAFDDIYDFTGMNEEMIKKHYSEREGWS